MTEVNWLKIVKNLKYILVKNAWNIVSKWEFLFTVDSTQRVSSSLEISEDEIAPFIPCHVDYLSLLAVWLHLLMLLANVYNLEKLNVKKHLQ